MVNTLKANARITVYGIPNCDTTQKAITWLKKRKINFVFHNYREEGITAVQQLDRLPRSLVRKTFDERFTAERMAKNYLEVFTRLIEQKQAEMEIQMLDNKAILLPSASRLVTKAANPDLQATSL